MKGILFFLALITTNIYSQEKKIFNENNAPFTLQCKRVGDLVIGKELPFNISSWCENLALEKAESYIMQLKTDISKSDDDITYHIILLKEEIPMFYTINFYNEKTLEEFGQLFIIFKDRENKLVDNINYLSKEDQAKSKSNNETLENIKLPPPPPPEKKN